MENIEISQAAGIGKFPGRFLKDDAEISSKPISEICNLSISHVIILNARKVAKHKPIFKNGKKVDHIQRQPPRGVRNKRCSENTQQIYRRTPMPKCDFNKVAKQLY